MKAEPIVCEKSKRGRSPRIVHTHTFNAKEEAMRARNTTARWISGIGVVIIFAVFLSLIGPQAAEGAPGKADLVSPSGTITGSTIAFTWRRVSGATWYYLWINDARGKKVKAWYTAEQVGGAAGENNCSVMLSTELVGTCQWWIRTWNTEGYGPWSNAMSFTVSHTAPTWHHILPSNDGTSCTSSRFTCVMNDQAVLDRETGLVWERSPDTTKKDWAYARAHCYTREVANRKGWRLPTIEELASLVDNDNASPSLPTGHPFSNVQSWYYWSSTTYANDTSLARDVGFGNGDVSTNAKSLKDNVWCVRGGHGHDAY